MLIVNSTNLFLTLSFLKANLLSTSQAPSPVNTVTRGDVDAVKSSTSFPDRQNVFEVHTKSGIVWYLQARSPVSCLCCEFQNFIVMFETP